MTIRIGKPQKTEIKTIDADIEKIKNAIRAGNDVVPSAKTGKCKVIKRKK